MKLASALPVYRTTISNIALTALHTQLFKLVVYF